MVWPGGPSIPTQMSEMSLSMLHSPFLSKRKGRASGLLSTEPGTGCVRVLVEQKTHKLPNTSFKDTLGWLGLPAVVMTFLSNPIALAHLDWRLTEVCSVLFQPEELQKERPASCIPRAPRAVRWFYAAWTCSWSALPLGCMYHLLALIMKDGWASIHTFWPQTSI